MAGACSPGCARRSEAERLEPQPGREFCSCSGPCAAGTLREMRNVRFAARTCPTIGLCARGDTCTGTVCGRQQLAAWQYSEVRNSVGSDLLWPLIRECGEPQIIDSVGLAIDANQRWDVGTAIPWLRRLTEFNIAWIEEPTSPDDVLGHAAIRRGVAPMPVSTGEHTQNRVIFKQLFQAGAVDLIQIDAARVGGVNENLAILLMAAKFGVRVFPHAGGVGLCELVQHLAMADYVAISGAMEDRAIEFVDHLHEHFLAPVKISAGRYVAPQVPGFSAEMRRQSIEDHVFPGGTAWQK